MNEKLSKQQGCEERNAGVRGHGKRLDIVEVTGCRQPYLKVG